VVIIVFFILFELIKTRKMTTRSQLSPRLVTKEPLRPEDDREFLKYCGIVF
jgi:hypothetical protein